MKSFKSTNFSYAPGSSAKERISSYNEELNSKIAQIHEKYEKAREKLNYQRESRGSHGYSI